MQEWTHYKCRCGYIFEEELGKYGCPFCHGNPPAKLVIKTPAKGVKR